MGVLVAGCQVSVFASTKGGETVIANPPKILEEAQLAQPGEHWLVTSAMYGLVTSPKDWSTFRDSELQNMVGSVAHERDEGEGHKMQSFSFRPMEDPNLWAIQEISEPHDKDTKVWGRVLGHMIVYVDDVLMVGPKKVREAASSTIQSRWSTSPPEYATIGGSSMRFLGIEIQRLQDGSYFLHQGCYAREVIDRRPAAQAYSFIRVPEEKEEEEAVSLPKVREAQKVTGELLWLSGKTRPDLSWAVMKMAQNAVKKPRFTVEWMLAQIFRELNLVMKAHWRYWSMHLSLQEMAIVCQAPLFSLLGEWPGAFV